MNPETKKPGPAIIWPFLSLAFGVFLLLSGAEYLLLGVIGVQDSAIVTYAKEVTRTRGGNTFTVTYEFTTPDGAQFNGTESGFQRKPGMVRIRYLRQVPSINRVEATPAATALMTGIYVVPGLAALVFGFWGLGRRAFASRPSAPADGAIPPKRAVGPWTVLACLILAPILGFAAYGVDRLELFSTPPAKRMAPEQAATSFGNTAGNLKEGGSFASDGRAVFFTDFTYSSIRCVSSEGGAVDLIYDGLANTLNVAGDRIYFLQFDAGEGVHAYWVSKTGGKAKKVLKDALVGLWVVGDWLFFTPEYGDEKLHRARLDGRGIEKLHDDVAHWVAFTPHWVYYCNAAKGDRVFRMRHNGAERGQIGQHRAADLLPVGAQLFYRNEDDDHHVWVMNADGSQDQLLLEVNARCLNADDRWLYYCDFDDDARLYRVPLTGGEPQRITDVGVLNPHILGEWIFVGVGDLITDLTPHRMRRDDGSGHPGRLEPWPPRR